MSSTIISALNTTNAAYTSNLTVVLLNCRCLHRENYFLVIRKTKSYGFLAYKQIHIL